MSEEKPNPGEVTAKRIAAGGSAGAAGLLLLVLNVLNGVKEDQSDLKTQMIGGQSELKAQFKDLAYNMELRFRDVGAEIQRNSEAVQMGTDDRLRLSQMRSYLKVFKANNPELNVPDL